MRRNRISVEYSKVETRELDGSNLNLAVVILFRS